MSTGNKFSIKNGNQIYKDEELFLILTDPEEGIEGENAAKEYVRLLNNKGKDFPLLRAIAATAVIINVLIYLVVALMAGEFNPLEWHVLVRMTWGFLGVSSLLVITSIAQQVEKEEK